MARRDGWLEREITWGDVHVGMVLATQRRSQRWEVVDEAQVTHAQHGMTNWFRLREHNSGEEWSCPPQFKLNAVTELVKTEGEPLVPIAAPSDADAIWLLVEELGATLLAHRDETTGEITCPSYEAGHNHPGATGAQALTEHLRFAHGMPVDDGTPIEHLITWHGQSHDPTTNVGKAGFPHRHIPEFLELYTDVSAIRY